MLNEKFQKFGKKSNTVTKERFPNAVIYTRVSTLKQENNFSLETQLEKCEKCAINNNLNVVERFGGAYESAKLGNKRTYFPQMLEFVKNKKNKIGYIIVYDLSRFSREGMKAVALVEELKTDFGIKVLESSATSIIDNFSEEIFTDLKIVIANSNNRERKMKIIDGSIKRLESGYWLGIPPRGYTKVDKYTLKFNEEAVFIKKAFEMKSDGCSNTEILKIIRSLGSTITKSRLPKYLSDPFYCGWIANKHLNGRVVKGLHESLISEEMFLKVNGEKAEIRIYKTSKMDENRPLQGDLKCSCGGVYTGYKKKEIYNYYKCNKCHHNSAVNPIHNSFEDLLSKYSFDKKYISLFKKQLKYTFDYIENENNIKKSELLTKISKEKTRLANVNFKYAAENLDEEIFQQVSTKIKADIDILNKELSNITFSLSNYDNYLDESLELVNDYKGIWGKGDIKIKKDIQNILFSNQIEYDPKKMSYRTHKENLVMSMLTGNRDKIKARKRGQKPTNSRIVLKMGIEPTLPKELDFESSASTNSAT
jgi:site-specific DNA recombinase